MKASSDSGADMEVEVLREAGGGMKRQIMVCTQETRNDAVVRRTGNGGGITTYNAW